jgi:hypothetical protein
MSASTELEVTAYDEFGRMRKEAVLCHFNPVHTFKIRVSKIHFYITYINLSFPWGF